MRTLIFVAALFFVTSAAARPVTGEQLARCSGHYFTAGVMSALIDDTENKIYYTLLAMMTSTRSFELIGYEHSRRLTDGVITGYRDRADRNTDITRPITANALRCDRLLSG